ncbi:MAG: DUF2007 domain-containing protein [Acidobacteriota bacterium]
MTDTPDIPNQDGSELVTIRIYNQSFVATWARSVLMAEGIDALLPDEAVSMVEGEGGIGAMGGRRVQVRKEDAVQADAILKELELQQQGPDPDGGARPDSGEWVEDPPMEAYCPHCGSDHVEADLHTSSDDENRVFLRCSQCGHRWEAGVVDELQEEDAGDGDPTAQAREFACPSCGSRDAESTSAPDYAGESPFTSFFRRLAGHGWYRCSKCGNVWRG